MSNYPHNQYTGGYDAPEQSSNPYLPPTYTNQYYPPGNSQPVPNPPAAIPTYGGYAYHHAVPAFNGAGLTSDVSPVPLFQGWNQDPVLTPSYSTIPASAQTPFTGYNALPQGPPPYYSQSAQSTYQHDTSTSAKPVDQAEMSEGEYEEGNIPDAFNEAHDYNENGVYNSFGSAQVTRHRHSSSHARAATPDSRTSRQGSDSYSPHISPVVANTLPNSLASQSMSRYDNNHGNIPDRQMYEYKLDPPQLSTSPSTSVVGNQGGNRTTHLPIVNPPLKDVSNTVNARSVVEGRKRAQGAILNLWPYNVRFQTYIDEGFREDIVGKLFDDLQMPRGSAAEVVEPGMTDFGIKQKPHFDPATLSHPTQVRNGTSSSGDNAATSTSGHGSSIPAANATVPIGVSTTATLSAASKPLNDKERTIQAKMEALKKSREERALKAAAQKDSKSASISAPNPVPAVAPNAIKDSETVSRAEFVQESLQVKRSRNDNQQLDRGDKRLPDNNISSQLAEPTRPQSVTSIPGLFLAAATPLAPVSEIAESLKAVSGQPISRKRPVASDFEYSLPSPAPLKRPFGHHRNDQTLVIDVSDDEGSQDEDVAMDLDSNQNSPARSSRSLSDQRSHPSTDSTSRPRQPPKKPISLNSTATSTPATPLGIAKSAMVRPAALQRKESEIEELKRRIAQAEARNKAKQTPSGTQTPISSLANATRILTPTPRGLDESGSFELPSAALNLGNKATIYTTDLQSGEKVSTTQSNTIEAEQGVGPEELARQEVLSRSNDYEELHRKLEYLRAEMASIEKAAQEARKLMNTAKEKELRLKAQKELKMKLQSQLEARAAASQMANAARTSTNSLASALDSADPVRGGPDHVASPSVQISTPHVDSLKTENPTERLEMFDNSAEALGDQSASEDKMVDEIVATRSESGEVLSNNDSPADRALEATLQEAIRAGAESSSEDDRDVDMEVDVESDKPSKDEADVFLTEMAKKGENSTNTSPEKRNSQEPEINDADYEPPEATPLLESAPSSPALTESPHANSDEQSQDELVLISDSSARGDSDVPKTNAQGEHQETMAPAEATRHKSTPQYTPYDSPLRRFKAYRFHPKFQEQTLGGLRSLTYSNKINPNQELCRYETAGGFCNDNTCDSLHFRDMALPDDAILTALGSPEQFQGARYEEFCNGLRALLMDLRVRKIRDFNVIAPEILAYRSRFLADDSRVLPLEGVTV